MVDKEKRPNYKWDMMRYGEILKANTFDTARGCYTIRIIAYNDFLYFHKMKNGEIVEVVRLQ